MQTSTLLRILPRLRRAAVLALALGAGTALAGPTDIGNAPLFTSTAGLIKPNIMFIMDDSGSMARDYLPDNANFARTKYGKKTAQCNGVGFNPKVSYTPPLKSDGTSMGNA